MSGPVPSRHIRPRPRLRDGAGRAGRVGHGRAGRSLGDAATIVFTGPVRNTDHGGTTRRGLLKAVGSGLSVGILAGCGVFDRTEPEPPADPLLPLLIQTRALVSAYDGFLAEHPDRAARLQPLRDTHAAHVTALAAVVVQPSPAPPASPSAAPATLAQLKALETAAARAAYDACLAATDQRITLLGEIAAARATHVVVLS